MESNYNNNNNKTRMAIDDVRSIYSTRLLRNCILPYYRLFLAISFFHFSKISLFATLTSLSLSLLLSFSLSPSFFLSLSLSPSPSSYLSPPISLSFTLLLSFSLVITLPPALSLTLLFPFILIHALHIIYCFPFLTEILSHLSNNYIFSLFIWFTSVKINISRIVATFSAICLIIAFSTYLFWQSNFIHTLHCLPADFLSLHICSSVHTPK